jgi:hypothetical protein
MIKRHVMRNPQGSAIDGASVHLRQGDLDGACGPYCLAMALIAFGLAERDELIAGRYHGNRRFAKFLRSLEQDKGRHLFRKGTTRDDFQKAIDQAFRRHVSLSYLSDHNAPSINFRDFTEWFLKSDAGVSPVILAIDFGKENAGKHWVLVVGWEETEDGGSSFLVLDPGGSPPRQRECWNVKIRAEGTGSPLPYLATPNQGADYRVRFIDAIGLRC